MLLLLTMIGGGAYLFAAIPEIKEIPTEVTTPEIQKPESLAPFTTDETIQKQKIEEPSLGINDEKQKPEEITTEIKKKTIDDDELKKELTKIQKDFELDKNTSDEKTAIDSENSNKLNELNKLDEFDFGNETNSDSDSEFFSENDMPEDIVDFDDSTIENENDTAENIQ